MEYLVSTDERDDGTSLQIWNPASGTKVMTLKGPACHINSLSAIRDEGFAAVEINKPFIHFWQSGQNLQSSRRILCPGKPCALAVHPKGTYFAVAIDEKIHFWQGSTGKILRSLNSSHFRPVTTMKFNSTGNVFVSGGSDGVVNAWNVVQLLANQNSSPNHTWSDHSLPVQAVHIGTGLKPTIFTCSLDRTCKVFSLLSGSMLLSVSFPVSLTSIVVDRSETSVYIGGKNGSIYQINLLAVPRSVEQHLLSDAAADSIFKKKHTVQVTALTVSADGRMLVSGDSEGNIYLWDAKSKQVLKTIQEPHQSQEATTNATETTNKRRVSNLSYWYGQLDNLKGAQKPTLCFPEVPKLVDAQDDGTSSGSIARVWNRIDTASEILGEEASSNSHMAQVSSMKMQLEKQQEVNEKLRQFCIKNIIKS